MVTDRDRLIREMHQKGISKWILGGVDVPEWTRQIELTQQHPEYFVPVFGIHPWTVANTDQADLEKQWLKLEGIIQQAQGIGETGLDLAPKWENTKAKQEEWFRRHLLLQNEVEKPLILHIVRAHTETLAILNELTPPAGGLVHAYTGDSSTAKKYLALGFIPSIGARVTYEKSTAVRDFVKRASLNEFVIETDCPDQPPEGHAEHTHGPETLFKIADTIAQLRGRESAEEILAQSAQNLLNLFAL